MQGIHDRKQTENKKFASINREPRPFARLRYTSARIGEVRKPGGQKKKKKEKPTTYTN
jgi:hypothetical protein